MQRLSAMVLSRRRVADLARAGAAGQDRSEGVGLYEGAGEGHGKLISWRANDQRSLPERRCWLKGGGWAGGALSLKLGSGGQRHQGNA